MSMLTHRLQVLISPEQHERLARAAADREVPIGVLVREAIDRALPDEQARRQAAWDRLMALEPIPVPDDPADLEAELDSMFDEPAE